MNIDIIQVLEFMDRGSIEDLLHCNSDGLPTSPLFRGVSPRTSSRTVAIPEYAIAAIAYQILWGLGYLHFESVLHRDIKVRYYLKTCFSCRSQSHCVTALLFSSPNNSLQMFSFHRLVK